MRVAGRSLQVVVFLGVAWSAGCTKGGASTPGGGAGGAAGAVSGTPAGGGAGGGSVVSPASDAGATGGTTSGQGTGGVTPMPGAAGAGGGMTAAGGGQAGALGDPSDAGAPDPGNPIVEAFAAQARAIATDYQAWGRVDDELRWAPFLCRIPLPGVARVSGSDDPATHGQKLYSVFAKNHEAYPNGPHTDQVVVKESWIPELVSDAGADFSPGTSRFAPDAGDHFYAFAKGDGGVYRTGAFAGLYIMFKASAGTPDTDEGWVYATITAAGDVTAAGRVASCMGCHEDATHERLFGVPLSPSLP